MATEISKFLGISIAFCTDYNSPAHVHVHYHPYSAVVNVPNLAVIDGNLPPRVMALVTEWIVLNRNAITQSWEAVKTGQGYIPHIPPLVE